MAKTKEKNDAKMKLEEAADLMNKSIEQFQASIRGIRMETTRRPNGISVDPHDPKMVGTIANALKAQGFNADVFSKTSVMVGVEPPSGEQKDEISLRIKKLGEEAKIAVRNIRKKSRKKAKFESKDEKRDFEQDLQNCTNEAIKIIDEIVVMKIGSL